jgi:uncharacterized integral membrane protein
MVCLGSRIVKLLAKRHTGCFILPAIGKNGWQEGFIVKWGLFVSFRFSLKEKAVLVVVLIIFVLAGGVLAVLTYENFATLTVEVHLTVFRWHTPALPLGVVLLFAFLSGALLLYVVTVLSALRDRRQLARLRRRVAELEQAQMSMGMGTQWYYPPAMMPMPGAQPNPPSQWLN